MRIRVFSLILIFCMIVVLLGLVFVQLIMYERYLVMSEGNRLKVIPLLAPRGSIVDREGRVLVKDVLSFDISVIYSRVKNVNSLAEALSPILAIPREELVKKIKKARSQPYTPFPIATDVGRERAINAEEISMDHPGLLLEVSGKREYIHGKVASNVLGYLGLINRSEFERLKPYGYRINDLMGRSGLEKQYDDYLRGTHGGKQVEVNHKGQEVMTMGLKEPVPGKLVELTIDLRLQEFCDKLLEDKRGAIVAMNPQTGAILSMSSAPSYDPNVFIERKDADEISRILNDKEYSLMNRAIAGAYPPGSVFKIIIALASLETGRATRDTTFSCNGSFVLGKRVFHCWREEGHGEQALKEALKNSCNVYFWRLGLLLGVDNIAEYAGKLGIGKETGVDLPGEVAGLLPSKDWKRKNLKEAWYKGETLNYAVGQGYLLCTPLQIVRVVSVFANKGFLVKPYIVEKIGGVEFKESGKEDIGASPDSIETVREGMRKVVNDKRGTGLKARQKDFIVSGKTGTAQTSRGKSHGWFSGFAPYDNAKLAVVVFDEYGGKGGYYAAETAGEVFAEAEKLGLLNEK